MHSFTVSFLRREDLAQGTMAFHFAKPAGFTFKPGQAVDLILTGPHAAAGADGRHTFSLVCAPYEDELIVATRMRDSVFKNALKALPTGSNVEIEGPAGSLTLHNKRERPALFIAGGIGITPFMSMLRQAARDRLAQDLVLLYANRRPEDSAFLAELQQLEVGNGRFRLVATMTDMAHSEKPWQGETDMPGEALIQKAAKGLVAPIYYLAGPPAMVGAMRDTLNGMGLDDDDIRSEDFFGY